MRNRIILSLFLFLALGITPFIGAASTVRNVVFAKRDTCNLLMDVYTPVVGAKNRICVIFVFGGGFLRGSKSEQLNVDFCHALADSGMVVMAIDYRLGMKGVGKVGVTNTKPMERAINMAVEDLYSATSYAVAHAVELGINKDKIVICGSSSGAITVLQADYERANAFPLAMATLPTGFKYAGVIPFAGAIFSHEGKPDYKSAPAPTLFFHGIDDKLVVYKHIRVFNLGLFGTNDLAAQFEKYDFPYTTIRYRDIGHEIAEVPMTHNLTDICRFIREYVIGGAHLKKNMWIKDPTLKHTSIGGSSVNDLYK